MEEKTVTTFSSVANRISEEIKVDSGVGSKSLSKRLSAKPAISVYDLDKE